MNSSDCHSLSATLDHALDLLDRNRTPDPEFVAAFDTLKQARARVARLMVCSDTSATLDADVRVAA